MATGPHGASARRTGWPARRGRRRPEQPVPQPGPARPRRRPRGRCVRLGGADRRRAEPRRARRRPGCRPSHAAAAPLPRHGHLLVVAGHRPHGPHDRRGAVSGGRPTRALAPAGRSQRTGPARQGPRPLRPCTPAACGSPAACSTSAAASRGSARACLPWWLRPTGRCTSSWTGRPACRRRGLTREVFPRCDPGRSTHRPPRPASTCGSRGSARCPGHRLPSGLPLGRPADPRAGREHPAVPRRHRRPRVYVVGQRFQHRRDSRLIDGARHDAQPSSPTSRRRAPPLARAGAVGDGEAAA